MDAGLLEELLWNSESNSLDFKRDQYDFWGDVAKKSELLKDILAFANSWRREDAYILIGVAEVKGSRSTPVGVAKHLADNDIQQFVNQKLNRPIAFSVEVVAVDGVNIDVIRIGRQKRPFFLEAQYSSLARGVVYIRQGSSTGQADPDEIYKMGQVDEGVAVTQPVLELSFAKITEKTLVGNTLTYSLEPLLPLDENDVPDNSNSSLRFTISLRHSNDEYYHELNNYLAFCSFTRPVGFAVINRSSVLASSVKVEIIIDRGPWFIVSESEFPGTPKKVHHLPLTRVPTGLIEDSIRLEKRSDHYYIEFFIPKVRPKETVWVDGVIHLGADCSETMSLRASIFADNIQSPLPVNLSVVFDVAAAVRITPTLLYKAAEIASD